MGGLTPELYWSTTWPMIPSTLLCQQLERHYRELELLMRSLTSCAMGGCGRMTRSVVPVCPDHWAPLPWQLKDAALTAHEECQQKGPEAAPKMEAALKAILEFWATRLAAGESLN